jgi:hypothetical protein
MHARLNLPNRAVGNNLIDGCLADVVTLLDSLSGIQPDNDAVFKKNITTHVEAAQKSACQPGYG